MQHDVGGVDDDVFDNITVQHNRSARDGTRGFLSLSYPLSFSFFLSFFYPPPPKQRERELSAALKSVCCTQLNLRAGFCLQF